MSALIDICGSFVLSFYPAEEEENDPTVTIVPELKGSTS